MRKDMNRKAIIKIHTMIMLFRTYIYIGLYSLDNIAYMTGAVIIGTSELVWLFIQWIDVTFVKDVHDIS